jgi:hypothetical protein
VRYLLPLLCLLTLGCEPKKPEPHIVQNIQLAHLSSGATGCPVAQIKIFQVSHYPDAEEARSKPQTWVSRCGQQPYWCTFWFDGPGRIVCATTQSEKAVP